MYNKIYIFGNYKQRIVILKTETELIIKTYKYMTLADILRLEDKLMTVTIGMVVGNKRWPMSHAHPDCWETPHAGVVLAYNDTIAWANTIRFPNRTPNQEELNKHLETIDHEELSIPVLWAFPDGPQVYWEAAESLRPYEQDVKEWEKAREEEYYKWHCYSNS